MGRCPRSAGFIGSRGDDGFSAIGFNVGKKELRNSSRVGPGGCVAGRFLCRSS